jgi:hypothetical protein
MRYGNLEVRVPTGPINIGVRKGKANAWFARDEMRTIAQKLHSSVLERRALS